MKGIPYRLLRHEGDESASEPVEKIIYLATARYGAGGLAMKRARRDFGTHEFACARAAQRYRAAEQMCATLTAGTPEYSAAVETRDRHLDEIRTEGDLANEAAERLVLCSLRENYQADAERVLDQLTDRDIRGCCALIEMGALPADFFGPSAAAPHAKPTSPSGAAPAALSSRTAIAPGRSSAAT